MQMIWMIAINIGFHFFSQRMAGLRVSKPALRTIDFSVAAALVWAITPVRFRPDHVTPSHNAPSDKTDLRIRL